MKKKVLKFGKPDKRKIAPTREEVATSQKAHEERLCGVLGWKNAVELLIGYAPMHEPGRVTHWLAAGRECLDGAREHLEHLKGSLASADDVRYPPLDPLIRELRVMGEELVCLRERVGPGNRPVAL
jgi:hypothetical protein